MAPAATMNTMKTFSKVVIFTLIFCALWVVAGFVFVAPEAIDHHTEYYFQLAIPYFLFLCLPTAILLFCRLKPLRIAAWVGIGITVLMALAATYSYFTISDFQRNGTLFDIIYCLPLLFLLLIGGPM
jgi:hypothetical protein